jgi:ribosomal protein S18 acetylase RimI-like enzyme
MAESMAEVLWQVEWENFNGTEIVPGIRADVVGFEEFVTFLGEAYSRVNHNPQDSFAVSAIIGDKVAHNRRVYYELSGDFFLLRSADATVGWFAATIADWSTYYLRSSGIIPEFQKQGIYKNFIASLLKFLSAYPVERVTAEVSPANLPVIKTLTTNGFNITGVDNTDRWGALVRLTKYLHTSGQETFLRHFCSGVFPQLETVDENRL